MISFKTAELHKQGICLFMLHLSCQMVWLDDNSKKANAYLIIYAAENIDGCN
jgi:hypothetical protein